MKPVTFIVPGRFDNPTNGAHGHWAVKASKRKSQRARVHLLMPALDLDPLFRVTMTRISSGELDFDGLVSSLKSARDAIAWKLGVDDRTRLVEWRYQQEKGPRGEPAVRVTIEQLGNFDSVP